MHGPGWKKKIILHLEEHFPWHFKKVTIRKNNMYDFRFQERDSHLAFKLCNFLTDDWEKNTEAANSQ